MFFRAYLGWSLKHVAQNYLFIEILFAKMSRMNKALACVTASGELFLNDVTMLHMGVRRGGQEGDPLASQNSMFFLTF